MELEKATVLYQIVTGLIYRTAMRIGDEKDSDEAGLKMKTWSGRI